jgi:hypothetical protein
VMLNFTTLAAETSFTGVCVTAVESSSSPAGLRYYNASAQSTIIFRNVTTSVGYPTATVDLADTSNIFRESASLSFTLDKTGTLDCALYDSIISNSGEDITPSPATQNEIRSVGVGVKAAAGEVGVITFTDLAPLIDYTAVCFTRNDEVPADVMPFFTNFTFTTDCCAFIALTGESTNLVSRAGEISDLFEVIASNAPTKGSSVSVTIGGEMYEGKKLEANRCG